MSKKSDISFLQEIIYAPLGVLLWLMSKLPFCILYLFADVIAFVAYRLIGYRRRIVHSNIIDSFPGRDKSECRKIEKDFYHSLADYFVETIKMRGMSKKQMRQHMRFENTQLIDKLLSEGKSIAIYCSHYGNWEWITSVSEWCNTRNAKYSHVYQPLRNKWFDRFFLHIRNTFSFSIPMKRVLRQFATWRSENTVFITGFLSDQRPRRSNQTYLIDFLGRQTEFIGGTEEVARKFNLAVLYFDTTRIKRGYYSSIIRLITDDACKMSPGAITQAYAQNLETTIRRYPAAYLWSHNRWCLPRKRK